MKLTPAERRLLAALPTETIEIRGRRTARCLLPDAVPKGTDRRTLANLWRKGLIEPIVLIEWLPIRLTAAGLLEASPPPAPGAGPAPSPEQGDHPHAP